MSRLFPFITTVLTDSASNVPKGAHRCNGRCAGQKNRPYASFAGTPTYVPDTVMSDTTTAPAPIIHCPQI